MIENTREWTVARGVKYVLKLTAFVFVPGLHQIAIGRRVFGSLLFALYFLSVFYMHFHPWNMTHFEDLLWHDKAQLLEYIARYLSWFLLAIDIRKVDNRSFKPAFCILVVCAGSFLFSGYFPMPRNLYLFVETQNDACPAFCKNDIILFDSRWGKQKSIAEGDYFIIGNKQSEYHVARILAGPPEIACKEKGVVSRYLPNKNSFCMKLSEKIDNRDYLYDYLVLGDGWNIQHVLEDGGKLTLINEDDIWGVNPRKIGNLEQYKLLNKPVTLAVGQTLLKIYEWTGINLFMSADQQSEPNTDQN